MRYQALFHVKRRNMQHRPIQRDAQLQRITATSHSKARFMHSPARHADGNTHMVTLDGVTLGYFASTGRGRRDGYAEQMETVTSSVRITRLSSPRHTFAIDVPNLDSRQSAKKLRQSGIITGSGRAESLVTAIPSPAGGASRPMIQSSARTSR